MAGRDQHTPQQIIQKLRQGDELPVKDSDVGKLAGELDVSVPMLQETMAFPQPFACKVVRQLRSTQGKELAKTSRTIGRRSAEVVARLGHAQPANRVPAGVGGLASRRVGDRQEVGALPLTQGKIMDEGP